VRENLQVKILLPSDPQNRRNPKIQEMASKNLLSPLLALPLTVSSIFCENHFLTGN
jgi:hypothetical protein